MANKILFKLIEGKGRFFLMRDVPEDEESVKMQVIISEALKNGEIVNPEVLPVSFYHNSVLGLGRLSHKETNDPIDDGQSFSLPDGMGFEETQYNFKKAIRLLPEKPVQKEESQESLWASIINDARGYDGTPQDLIKLTAFYNKGFNEAIEEVLKLTCKPNLSPQQFIDEIEKLKK